MSPLRVIGYAGLAVLTVAGSLLIYLSVGKDDWFGVAMGIGALVLFAVLGNLLWLVGFRRKRPDADAAPNRAVLGLFFALLGAFAGAGSVQGFMSDNWLAACAALAAALVLFERAYRVVSRRA
jgi:peptidoglycan/LPS O-acetylase OafA/YrhL